MDHEMQPEKEKEKRKDSMGSTHSSLWRVRVGHLPSPGSIACESEQGSSRKSFLFLAFPPSLPETPTIRIIQSGERSTSGRGKQQPLVPTSATGFCYLSHANLEKANLYFRRALEGYTSSVFISETKSFL